MADVPQEHPSEDSARRPRRKRGAGEGSISQHASGGWRGRIMVGYLPNGRPDVREVYAKTRTEVRKKLDVLRQRSESGTLTEATAERLTVAAFLSRWLEATKATVRPKTWDRYGEYVRLHLTPTLGKTKLSALRPEALLKLYATKQEAGLSPRTVHHLHTVLHSALAQAVRWGYLHRNVADAVDPPAVPRREMRPPTPAEVAQFLDAVTAADDRLAALWIVAAYSGCREGELLGLQWQDVDLDRASVTIRRTLVDARKGVPRYGEPKTGRSRRTVSLPPEAVAALRRHRTKQDAERDRLGVDYAPYGLVFATAAGRPLLARNVIRSFKAALVAAGLPRETRVHDLRHAAATVLLRAGVHPKVVSERLGHSTIGITMDLYTHSVEGLDADAAARMQRVLRGEEDPPDDTSGEGSAQPPEQ